MINKVTITKLSLFVLLVCSLLTLLAALQIPGPCRKDLRFARNYAMCLNHGVLRAPQSMQTYSEAMFTNTNSMFCFWLSIRNALQLVEYTALRGRGEKRRTVRKRARSSPKRSVPAKLRGDHLSKK